MPSAKAGRSRAQTPALLKGLIFDADGRAMSPSHTRKRQKLYRYYVSQSVIRDVAVGERVSGDGGGVSVRRVPASDVEAAVITQLRTLLRSPEIIVATWRVARKEIEGLTETEVREALERLDPLWDELFPAEQSRIVRLLVDRVDIAAAGIDIRLRVDGLGSLFNEVHGGNAEGIHDDGELVAVRAA